MIGLMELVALKYLDRDNAYRRQLAKWYRENLGGNEKVRFIEINPECESSTHLVQIRVKNREELMLALNEHQVYPGVHYRDNTEYRMYAHGNGTCPKAALASQEIISLPVHMGLSKADVDTVSQLVAKYAK
ncbi:UDP-4-amino-4-deoxy-L-arabinose--oxoglutarate aminotransferase [Pseudomonas fluorescens]|uniref:UDP-4-amino-4-deoxy-L-arabinose--oxoglutarate aminotransferase n=2 Tax=Pseudomonas fluorescens TaxID=294 RepID=A0A5E6SCJ4_PSEFL|nr:UDP-4-amino-4-deoxy-L-arabinose--oxoglutarate aminotransferase [Pseudomonas fluorescens]